MTEKISDRKMRQAVREHWAEFISQADAPDDAKWDSCIIWRDECLRLASKIRRSPPPAVEGGWRERRGIYIASKTRHADRWKALRAAGEPIISTWIDEAGPGESSDLNDLWARCIREASSCEVLIAYREPEDILKGAWIEIGAALAVGIPVVGVGLRDFTIANYEKITHMKSIGNAFAAANAIRAALPTPPAGEKP